jgi:predicted nucleic acid-binding protein
MSYIDTSVLVAYYCPEPISAKAEKVILGADPPTVSHLVEVEFVSAVARKVREKQLSQETAHRIINEFQSHLSQSLFKRIPMEGDHFRLAFNWLALFEMPLSTLDALHLAAASANNMEMITIDRQLSRAAQKLGIQSRLLR